MKRFFKKIPITIWTLAVISFCVYIVSDNIVTFDNNKLTNITSLLTIIGLYYLAHQLKEQTKNERISTEYLNQSDFEFIGFCQDKLENASPCLCSEPGTQNYNLCSDIHWFNIIQIGKLPAKEMRITLIHHGEENDISELLNIRTQIDPMVYNGNKHQFKLPSDAVPLDLFDANRNNMFYILLDYRSVYTNIHYKRIYELSYRPNLEIENPITWVKNIEYYSLTLTHILDSESISWKEILLNIKRKLGGNKELNFRNWLIDL